jgi:uncharacterized UPF0160 family protein
MALGARASFRYLVLLLAGEMMPLQVATHDGPFHADDVLAWALLRTYVDGDAEVVRTRDPDKLAQADIVFDVGGEFDPERGRFDHHQASYTGPLSSAGMVLQWLRDTGRIDPFLATHLRDAIVSYVDDVDNGRVAPKSGIPCFPKLVDAFNQPAGSHPEYDAAFRAAGEMAAGVVRGLHAEHESIARAREIIGSAMKAAVDDGRRVLFLDGYVRWKPAYFQLGGADHPTDFVLFPSTDGSWRIVAIPPELGSFAQKKPLPEAWAGLTDDELEAVTGIPGSVFCHKNRFIAVFKTREGAVKALEDNGLMR